MASDPLVLKILSDLRRSDAAVASRAERALGQLLATGGLADLTQYDLQLYLWFGLTDIDQPLLTAQALAQFFGLAEMSRYAGIANAQRTAEILRAYSDHGRAIGLRAAKQAMDASGLRPPDLPELQWGELMGPAERQAHTLVAATLELALAAGELVPGQRGWRLTQQRLTRQHLSQARRDGPPLLDRVRAERIDAWAQSGGESRQRLVLAILAGVVVEPVPPRDVVGRLAPMQWLLGLAAGRGGGQPGVPLTLSGNLTRWIVQEAADRFAWWDVTIRAPRSESDLWQLGELRGCLQRIGGLRRNGRRLVLTTRGKSLLDDPVAQWRAATAALVDSGGPTAAIGELALILLLHADGMLEREALAEEAVRAAPVWPSASRVDEGHLVDAVSALMRRCQLWSLVEEDRGPGYQTRVRLSEPGHRAGFAALRWRALRPRSSTRARR